MTNRYKSIFPDEDRDLLDIAKDLDIRCCKLIAERDKLLEIMTLANVAVELASVTVKGSAKNLTPRLLALEVAIEEYYKSIEVSKGDKDENICE